MMLERSVIILYQLKELGDGMIDFKECYVMNFENAMRGARNHELTEAAHKNELKTSLCLVVTVDDEHKHPSEGPN